MSRPDALAVIGSELARLARSAATARKVGLPSLADARRLQIIALNDVRRTLLGRTRSFMGEA